MGARKPGHLEVIDGSFPVRLTVYADGTPRDWKSEEVTRWLVRLLGDGGWNTTPAFTFSGMRAYHLHLPSLYVASALVLACPHLQLPRERYDGPVR